MNVLLAATGALAFAPTAFGQSTQFAGAASERQPRPLVELIPVSARANTVRNTGSKIYFAAQEASSGSSDLDGDGDATDLVPSIFDPATGTLTHILYDAVLFHVGKGFLALLRDEADSGDINGDGDSTDRILGIYDVATGTMDHVPGGSNELGFHDTRGPFLSYSGLVMGGPTRFYSHETRAHVETDGFGTFGSEWGSLGAVYVVRESNATGDLNGDGDLFDTIVRFANSDLSVQLDSALACEPGSIITAADWQFVGDAYYFTAKERRNGVDVNGDGQLGVENVVYRFDVTSGMTDVVAVTPPSFGPAFAYLGGRLFLNMDERFAGDLNGDGDTQDYSLVAMDPDGTIQAALGRPAIVRSSQGGHAVYTVGDSVRTWDLGSGQVHDTGLAIGAWHNVHQSSSHAVFLAKESLSSQDINGDGDLSDSIPCVITFATQSVVAAGFTSTFLIAEPGLRGGVLLNVTEEEFGDLTGDGDATDDVAAIFHPESGRIAPLNYALSVSVSSLGLASSGITLVDGRFTFLTLETLQGEDLNGDGDRFDWMPVTGMLR